MQDKPDIIHRPFQHHKVQRSGTKVHRIFMYYIQVAQTLLGGVQMINIKLVTFVSRVFVK